MNKPMHKKFNLPFCKVCVKRLCDKIKYSHLALDLIGKSSQLTLAIEVTSPTALPKTDIREQFAEHFNRFQGKLSKFNEVFVKLGSDPTGLDEMEEGGLVSVSGVVSTITDYKRKL